MRFLICAMCVFAGAAAQANDGKQETCSLMGDLAQVIMENRQMNIPLSKMMDASPEPTLQKIVLLAYEQPAFSTAENQNRAVQQFRNSIELACYTNMRFDQ